MRLAMFLLLAFVVIAVTDVVLERLGVSGVGAAGLAVFVGILSAVVALSPTRRS